MIHAPPFVPAKRGLLYGRVSKDCFLPCDAVVERLTNVRLAGTPTVLPATRLGHQQTHGAKLNSYERR